VIVILIAACEVGFWIVLVGGLLARYVWGARRLGLVLLAAVPAIDLALLVATAVDLRSGAVASQAHGLAALYLGFSVSYGHRLVRWADVRVAHRFAGGPPPQRPAGREYTRLCWGDVGRTTLAAGISAVIVQALVLWVGDPARTAALQGVFPVLGIAWVVDVLWAVSFTLWPRPEPARRGGPAN
jgi:hypothetical protein